MGTNKIITTIVVLLFISCCEGEERTIKSFKNGDRAVITRTCNGEVLNYSHFNLDNERVFSLDYQNGNPVKPFKEGTPWIHFIWNFRNKDGMDYCRGDTMHLEINIANPPLLSYELKIMHDGREKSFTANQPINYRAVAKDSVEDFNFKLIYTYKEEKWATIKKHQPIIIGQCH